jgi:hypothetical protein
VQDKYVADIGDFGKFQLFRYLLNHRESPLNGKGLAQIWFMHENDEEGNSDGSHINYFERMRGSDAYLEESLLSLIMRDKREVIELEALQLLPNTSFFYEKVPKALEDRYLWLNKALTFSNKAQIVAVAPDNGMALKCNRAEQCFEFLTLKNDYAQKPSPHKYIFADEVSYFYRLPHLEVCIVYQHLNRCFPHEIQIELLLRELKNEYPYLAAIKHKPYSPRLFFFLCKSDVILEGIMMRLTQFVSEFDEFWELYK